MGRIVRLEIDNFKSYGGAHVVGPFKRFTAIIGPNGAGKSNLMDAISFVLGVSSRQLRSQQLRDLVHKPPPPPPSSSNHSASVVVPPLRARVTLVFETDDGVEVRFTRTISDKGVGAYRLDDRDVSFDAYQQRLSAVGVLAKARNCLVFQGDVESVASKSPEELTQFFEQISTSDELRDEYERLLEAKNAAEEDAIFAYQKKKGLVAEKRMVREQKEEAEAFRAKLQALHDLRVEHYLWQLFQLEEDALSRRADVASLQQALLALAAKEETATAAYRDQKKAHSSALRELKASRERVHTLQAALDERQPRSIRLREQRKHAQKKLAEAESAEQRLRQQLGSKTSELSGLKRDLEELAAAKAELDAQEKQPRGDKSDGDDADESLLLHDAARLDEYHRIKERVQVETTLLRTELEGIQRQQSVDSNKVETLSQELRENEKICAMLAEDTKIADERIRKMKDVIVQTERAIVDAERDVRTAEAEIHTQGERKAKLQDQLQRVNARLRDLKDDKRQSHAESRKAETIETLRRLIPGVLGRLVDLCKPLERKYNMAVTVATGKHMDAIVVKDAKTGQACIQYLRESRLGSAQFLPLDTIRIKPINERFRTLGDRIKLIVDVVECDAEIKPALLYAVGDTVVCDSIDVARDVCFRQREKVKAVTLNGMVVSKNGSMTGGKTPSDVARASRWDEKEVEALEAQRDALSEQLRAFATPGGSYSKVQAVRTQLEGLQNRLRYAKADVVATEAKRPKLQTRMAEARGRIDATLEPELRTYAAAVRSRKDAIRALETQVHRVEDERFAAFSAQMGVASIRVYEATVLRRQQKHAETRRKLTDHMTKLAAQIEYVESQDVDGRLRDAHETIASEQERLADLARQAHALEQDVAALGEEKNAAVAQLTSKSRTLETLESELTALGKRKARGEHEKRELLSQITAEETALERLADRKREVVRRAALDQVTLPLVGGGGGARASDKDAGRRRTSETDDAEMEDVGTIMPTDQAVDLSALPDAVAVAVEDARAYDRVHARYEERIHALVADLDRVQPNLRALDQFDAIQGRIATEEDALERVKQRSVEAAAAFEAVRAERYERFMVAFTHVAGGIGETYKQLTQSSKHPLGGTAYLTLESVEEPFLHGVKYHAMPPMKRFREMEQLSGGEKTVAALALLFAVHAFRPSPFFVLDEVDAALDNVNVNKVSTYIATCGFQCVVISLKDTFYEKADALVGVCKDLKQQRSHALTVDMTTFD